MTTHPGDTSLTPVRVLDRTVPSSVFDDPSRLPADPQGLAALGRQVGGAGLAAPPVVLPDFHHKSKMELPSSVAVATTSTVRPDLTGSSVNCGMALIAVDSEVPDERAMERFMRAVRERYPYPTKGRRDLTTSEVVRSADQGAEFGVERWDAPPEDLERIEEGGRLDLDRYGGIDRLTSELPGLAWQLARYRFGTVGPSNHFVELQRVEEVLDPERAALLGVREGQLTIQYHGGGGVLTGEIGRLFFRRKDYPRQIRAVNLALKPWFHLRSARSYAELRQRLSLYFTDGCPPLELASDEGQRLMLANAAAMNYGFAFRVSTYAALRKLAAETFGGATGRLVVDSPHNSIYEEPVGERHRGGAPAQLLPGLPGRDDAGGHDLRDHRSGRAAAGDAPHLELPRGGRADVRAQPALGLPRRRDRGLRPRRAAGCRTPTPRAAARCASATPTRHPPGRPTSTTTA